MILFHNDRHGQRMQCINYCNMIWLQLSFLGLNSGIHLINNLIQIPVEIGLPDAGQGLSSIYNLSIFFGKYFKEINCWFVFSFTFCNLNLTMVKSLSKLTRFCIQFNFGYCANCYKLNECSWLKLSISFWNSVECSILTGYK